MKSKIPLLLMLAPALLLIGATSTMVMRAADAPPRPEGPCDIYAAAGTPCVAAHSTTRALYASYNGPLYQIKRQSDGKTLDVGVTAEGFADAAAHDGFCVHALCVINLISDQSGKDQSSLPGASRTELPRPGQGGFDTRPIAGMAPITVGGHKAYGVYIMPGMEFRNNDAKDIAINDEPGGIYYVIDGTHYDSGCRFDRGQGWNDPLRLGREHAHGSGDHARKPLRIEGLVDQATRGARPCSKPCLTRARSSERRFSGPCSRRTTSRRSAKRSLSSTPAGTAIRRVCSL